MNFKNLTDLEKQIAETGNKGEYQLREYSIPVPGEDLTLQGFLATPVSRSKYYYDVTHPKERIVLHFTAGNIRSDLNALTRDNYHVSVAFVIGRNGTIYQLFSSKFWSGHIGKGKGNSGTGNNQDKLSIGIELSNYGYLTERDGNLETYYSRLKDSNGKTGPTDIYCSLADKEAYVKTAAPFRQQSYYATHTEAQYESLIILLRYLTKTYDIPRKFLPEPKRYEATDEVLNFKGIVTHINYRSDGKWDIGPGFDWDKVIQGVQAETFKPTFNSRQATGTRGAALEGMQNMIHSEDALEEFLPGAKEASKQDDPYNEEGV